MSSGQFDLDFLTNLLAQPEREPRTKKVVDTRDNDTWFKQEHIVMGCCTNPNCVSIELKQEKGRNRVTAIINGYEMCRFCFLYGWQHKE